MPSLLGDREGRARPGDRNTCVNKYDSKQKSTQIELLTVPVGLEKSMVSKYSF